MGNKQMPNLSPLEVLPVPRNHTHTIRIPGDRIHASDDEIGFLNLSRATRSAGNQGPSGVKDGKLRFDDCSQIADGLIHVVLRVEAPSIPDETHESLHA